MNKLITKIAALSVGLAMAVGVGVAIGGHKDSKVVKAAEGDAVTTIAGITSGNKYYICATVNSTKYYWKPSGTDVGTGLSGSSTTNKGESEPVTLSGSGSSWSIQFENGNYLTLASSKANGKYNVSESEAVWTVTEVNNLLNFAINGYCLQKNSSTSLNFGSYKSGQTNIWFEEAANEDPTLDDLVIKNSSSEVGPFNNLSDNFVGGYMFYAYDASTGDAKNVEFSIGNSAIASIVDNGNGSCCVTPIKAGTTKLIAELSGYNKYEVNLTFVHNYEHEGTEADPYSVADAVARCIAIGETASADKYYVRGYITKVTSTLSDVTSYGNVTFEMSDDPDNTTNVFTAFQVRYIGDVAFTEEYFDKLVVGHIAVVYGAFLNYKSGTPETDGKGRSHIISLEAPSTGDIEIVFEPNTSLEIGDADTFTATFTATNPTVTWSVENSSVLSVDALTGEYEALALGKTKVTISVSADEGTGSADAYIIVNGSDYLKVDEALALIESLETNDASEYYVKVEGYVSNLAYVYSANNNGIEIVNEAETASLIVFTGKGGYSSFVDGLSLGDAVRIQAKIQNYNGTTPELTGAPIRLYKETVAMSFAYSFLNATNAICNDYDGITDNSDALLSVWSNLKDIYTNLNDAQKSRLADPTMYGCGDTIKSAMSLYDYVTGKYGLENFISGRTPVAFASESISMGNNNSTDMLIVIVAFGVSTLFFVTLCVVRKRKGLRK